MGRFRPCPHGWQTAGSAPMKNRFNNVANRRDERTMGPFSRSKRRFRSTTLGVGWGHGSGGCASDTSGLYEGSNSWDNTANDYVTVLFNDTQFKLYGVQNTINGIGAVSIDGGSETPVDFYATARKGNVLLWTSPVLAEGTHALKLRVTGMADPASGPSNCPACVSVDRADIVP